MKIPSKVRKQAASGKRRSSVVPATSADEPVPSSFSSKHNGGFVISSDIRRAPVKKVSTKDDGLYKRFDGLPSMPTNGVIDNEFMFPIFGDEVSGTDADYQQIDAPQKISIDGTRTFLADSDRAYTPGLIVYDTLSRDNRPRLLQRKKYTRDGRGNFIGTDSSMQWPMLIPPTLQPGANVAEAQGLVYMNEDDKGDNEWTFAATEAKAALAEGTSARIQIPNTDSTAAVPSTSLETVTVSSTAAVTQTLGFQSANASGELVGEQQRAATDGEQTWQDSDEAAVIATATPQYDDEVTEYDPANFYHTPPPKRPPPTEKVLTFCTKEIAVRDAHNLVIACGSEEDVWRPARCPEGSDCFLSSDSTYRICCTVAEAADYMR